MRSKQWRPCEQCGRRVFKLKRPDRHIYCEDCATQATVSAALQMAAKAGPVWEAWCASNAAGAPGRDHTPKE